MAFDPEVLEQAVPPLNPDEGLVQLAMAKGKGKIPLMKDPIERPDPIKPLDLDIPLQIEKGKSLEDLKSEKLNLETEITAIEKSDQIKSFEGGKEALDKIDTNFKKILTIDEQIKAIESTKQPEVVEGVIDFGMDQPVMKWATPDAIREINQDRFTIGQLMSMLKEKVSKTELDETSFVPALQNSAYLKGAFQLDKGQMLKTPIKGVKLDKIQDVGPDGKVIETLFRVVEDNRPFDMNTVITKEQALAVFNEVAPKIKANMFSSQPIKSAISEFNNFLTKRGDTQYIKGQSIEGALKNRPLTREGENLRQMILSDLNMISEGLTQKESGNMTTISVDAGARDAAINRLNTFFSDNYGVKNVFENGIDIYSTDIPAYVKRAGNIWLDILKGRGLNYQTEGKPSHGSTQFLPGSMNQSELVFHYEPGRLRQNEPKYSNDHSFPMTLDNIFVWTRFSDRYDNKNRKLLFVEEIQSDMHQKVRGGTKKYVMRQDKPNPKVRKLQDELQQLQKELNQEWQPNDPRREQVRVEIKALEQKLDAEGVLKGDTTEGPFKKSEHYANFALKNVIRYALDNGYDGVALISGKAKNVANNNSAGSKQAKGTLAAYDRIYAKTLKEIANDKKLYFPETGVIIKDGNGVNWARLPAIIFNEKSIKEIRGDGFKTYKAKGGFVLNPRREIMKDVVPTL
tara:strand:+ start:331 stop:2382 length:2052 start_codon:yes stop_codon:yes gene_type:complete